MFGVTVRHENMFESALAIPILLEGGGQLWRVNCKCTKRVRNNKTYTRKEKIIRPDKILMLKVR